MNRLAKETSPYLLQHAHNPVDWYPWGEEALRKAREENKPMLISIGYAACHWCHVMEKESFENEEVSGIMNKHFVNIKIDREERPDLDHIYMDAVQAMTGSGGWPLNVFLTPEAKPFYGGTYFPPQPGFNRPSWKDVLQGVAKAFQEKRHEIDAQAETLTEHMIQANAFGQQKPDDELSHKNVFNPANLETMFTNIMTAADKENGGFGRAPKFPQTFTIQYLLHYYYHTKNEEALRQARLSLDKMIYGGIYDQLGGGFARYSTDSDWLAPHFEKMLYDNALLIIVLCEAYLLTKKDLYKRAIQQTLVFTERELLSPEKGFYSALDADSEGVEGKFYVWDKEEIERILGLDAYLFCEYYGVTEKGNWEHKNILHIRTSPKSFAEEKSISLQELLDKMDDCCRRLLEHRTKRIRPMLDDKILLGWNALMNIAYCKAFAATGFEHYRKMAVENLDFIWRHFQTEEQAFYHTYKKGQAKYPAFLDDYAYLIQVLIHLQEITADVGYLQRARDLLEFVIDYFSEKETGYFFYTHTNQSDVIVRKKEMYDGAVPSGNSIMATNLYYLGVVFNKPEWRERAVKICSLLHQAVNRYPTSFAVWATLIQGLTYGIPEISIVGENFADIHRDFLRTFIPFRIIQAATLTNDHYPLLAGKPNSPHPQLYLCKNFVCQSPVTKLEELVRLLENV